MARKAASDAVGRQHGRIATSRRALRFLSFQILDQFQHIPAIFRGNFSRAIMRTAVLELVALLEQSAQPLPRIAVESKRVRRCLCINYVWVDLATARC